MKDNKLYIVLGIVIAIVVLLGASYLGRSIMSRQNSISIQPNNKETQSAINLNGNTCYDTSNYFVVTKADAVSAGNDILIKYKSDENQNIPCEYSVATNDFELKNTCSDGLVCYRAQWFKYIKDNLLFVDLGTGTSRSLEVYNLGTKEKVFNDNYHGELDLKGSTLTYWRFTKDIPNQENCSKIDEYKNNGMGAQIETKVSLNLIDLTKKEFEEFRCLQAE